MEKTEIHELLERLKRIEYLLDSQRQDLKDLKDEFYHFMGKPTDNHILRDKTNNDDDEIDF